MRILHIAIALLSAIVATDATAQNQQPVVGIYRMDDVAQTGIADTMSTMIETAIISTGKFRVIERERLSRLEAEQNNARRGRVTTNQPGRNGGFEGVDFLIYGSISGISTSSSSDFGSSMLAGVLGNRNASCGRSNVTLTMDIRITDTNTGEVKIATSINETARSATVCNASGQIDSTVLMRGAAAKIARELVTTIYPIQVAAVQGDGTVVLNYGSGTLAVGDILTMYSRGEAIIDPATGQEIGRDETKLGMIQVTEVTVRTSRGVAVGPAAGAPPIGTVARPATEADLATVRGGTRNRRRGN